MSREGHDLTKNTEVLKQVVERGKEATTSPEGLSYPKQSVGQKGGELGGVPQFPRGGPTNHEERDAYARQQIVGPWAGSVMVPQRRDFHGVIDPLLSWKESIGRKRG
ncbi:hypothetical protein BHM03_00033261 [Ensete ventricosum]|nr:hypothetical protein BHM03_00033261 [Ensete ventricosum]